MCTFTFESSGSQFAGFQVWKIGRDVAVIQTRRGHGRNTHRDNWDGGMALSSQEMYMCDGT